MSIFKYFKNKIFKQKHTNNFEEFADLGKTDSSKSTTDNKLFNKLKTLNVEKCLSIGYNFLENINFGTNQVIVLRKVVAGNKCKYLFYCDNTLTHYCVSQKEEVFVLKKIISLYEPFSIFQIVLYFLNRNDIVKIVDFEQCDSLMYKYVVFQYSMFSFCKKIETGVCDSVNGKHKFITLYQKDS